MSLDSVPTCVADDCAPRPAWFREQLPRVRAKARALEQSDVRFELLASFGE